MTPTSKPPPKPPDRDRHRDLRTAAMILTGVACVCALEAFGVYALFKRDPQNAPLLFLDLLTGPPMAAGMQ